MTAHRPWWASDGPVDGGVDPAEDPLEVYRAARHGREDPGGLGSEDDATQPGPSSGPTQPGPSSGPTQPGTEVCGVCPICTAARVLGETRPELLAHLVEAGRHLTAAMRTLLAPGDVPTGEGPAASSEDQVRRIDLD